MLQPIHVIQIRAALIQFVANKAELFLVYVWPDFSEIHTKDVRKSALWIKIVLHIKRAFGTDAKIHARVLVDEMPNAK